jgi:hypothetical protein
MIRKYIFKCCYLVLFAGLLLDSCKKKEPSIDNYFLNYTIPDLPPTADYTVGCLYYSYTTWNVNIKYVPTIGIYTTSTAGVVPPTIMQAHIADALSAKIDYFVFSVRSPTLDHNNYLIDSNVVTSFLNAPNSSSLHFAVSYNMSTATLGITNTGNADANGNVRGTPIEANATKLLGFYNDFKRLAYWFTKANYQKVNGKWLIIMNHAQDLNSNMDPNTPGSNEPLYAQLRKNLSVLGFDLYIIGEQDQWSVPNNYYYREQNCVDAMYESNMTDNRGVLDRNYLFATTCDQNFAYWKKELESWPAGGLTPGTKNLEFVPMIESGFNYQIAAPTSASLSIPRTADGAFYRTFTNIAKRNASASRLILIDSFNAFPNDTQIEPVASSGNTTIFPVYGTNLLDITRTEFKVSQ